MTTEFEIKLCCSPLTAAKVREDFMHKGDKRRLHLQATYFDTENALLSRHGMGIRLRKEGRNWVQTLKVDTKSDFERYEHNAPVTLVPPHDKPSLDLERHRDSPAGQKLFQLIDKQDKYQRLQVYFHADIWRRRYVVARKTSSLECVFDEGVIEIPQTTRKKQDKQVFSINIAEIEIELQSGSTIDVFEQAKFFVRRYGVWIDTRTKAQKGFALAQQQTIIPATLAKRVYLPQDCDDHTLIKILVEACLKQILPNAAQLAVAQEPFASYEHHVHQLRVGLRRLRALTKLLTQAQVSMPENGVVICKTVFTALGLSRDHCIVNQILENALKGPHAPIIEPWQGVAGPDLAQVVRQTSFQLLMLDLLKITQAPLEGSSTGIPLSVALVKILQRQYRQCKKQARKFLLLEETARHNLRKKLKELRYNFELLRSFSKNPAAYQSFNRRLQKVLDVLGQYHDLCVARDAFKTQLSQQPTTWFLLGWVASQEEQHVIGTDRALKKLFKLKFPF